MIRSLLMLVVVLPVLYSSAYSQSPGSTVTLKGKILDRQSRLPLAYASVGVLNMPYGTVADSSGRYSFIVDRLGGLDSLQVSMVGYYSSRLAIADIIKTEGTEVLLEKKPEELQEVIIRNKEWQTEIVGRESAKKFLQVSLHKKGSADLTIGSEFGIRVNNSHSGAVLKNFNWFISENNFRKIKLRLNIYSVKDDMPDTLICKQQILVTLTGFKTGWNRINLDDYNIFINSDCIVTLQWLEGYTDNTKKPLTMVPAAVSFSKNCYARIASQDKWERVRVTPSCYVTLLY